MCLKKAPSFKDHWANDDLLETKYIFERMGRDHWMKIHYWLHCQVE